MIVSKTPFRISLFGGGSDYPRWFESYGGCSLGFSIDKYCYLSVRYLPPFFDHKFRIVYSEIELVNSVAQIKHPVVREALNYLGIESGVELHHFSDLPARSGLGSSSSFTVGVLNALSALSGKTFSKEELCLESIHLEQEILNEAVGSQDQTLVCHGGPNFVRFNKDGSVQVEGQENIENWRALGANLQLFFTGISRNSMVNAEKIVSNVEQKKNAIFTFMDMAEEARFIITMGRGDLDQVGRMLGEAWELKKTLADTISNRVIDDAYERAIAAGALGGKVLGAGGGGFLLFYTPESRQSEVSEALKGLTEVKFDLDTKGTRLLEGSRPS